MRLTFLVVSLTATSIQPAFAASEHFVAGRLECELSRSEGAVLGSKQDVDCLFLPSEQGAPVRYTGLIDNFGLDVGEVEKAKMVWAVTRGQQAADFRSGRHLSRRGSSGSCWRWRRRGNPNGWYPRHVFPAADRRQRT